MAVVSKIKSTMEVATEVEGANEMKSEMEVPVEWICKKSSNWEEIPVTSRKWMICLMGGSNWYDIYNGSQWCNWQS